MPPFATDSIRHFLGHAPAEIQIGLISRRENSFSLRMITCEDECITKKRDEKQEAETCLDLAKMSDNGKQLWLKNGTIRFLSVIITIF